MATLSALIIALSLRTLAAKEINWPSDVPSLFALYKFDEGTGMELNNQMCTSASVPGCGVDPFLGSNKGIVYVEDEHQPGWDASEQNCGSSPCHPGANWLSDPHFGTVLSCGDGTTLHKDAIRLPDLDYGSGGKWAFNWWLKTEEGHEDYDSEYLLTHGAPNTPTSSRHHIFMFMRGTGISGGRRRRAGVVDDGVDPYIRMNIFDGNDPPRCDEGLAGRRRRRGSPMNEANCTMGSIPTGNPAMEDCDGTVECWTNPRQEMYGLGSQCCKTADEAASDPSYDNLVIGQSSGGTADTNFSADCPLDDNRWHMITVTTNKAGSGWRLLIDGVLRGSNPDLGPGWSTNTDNDHVYGGDPIDPNSTISLCGRDQWTGWHEHRYYLGRIAHFAVLKDGLSDAEVQALYRVYWDQFGFDISPNCSHFGDYTETSGVYGITGLSIYTAAVLVLVGSAPAHRY
jgi:hypothetical protein